MTVRLNHADHRDLTASIPRLHLQPEFGGHMEIGAAVNPTGNIAIVEDDTSMREALSFQLETAGHRVVSHPLAETFLEGEQPLGSMKNQHLVTQNLQVHFQPPTDRQVVVQNDNRSFAPAGHRRASPLRTERSK